VVVILSLGAVGVAAVIAFHVHRWRAGGTAGRSLPAAPLRPAVQGAPAPRTAVQAPREPRPAIEQPIEQHVHFHGLTAEDVAAILERQRQDE
jgi:hypothetical protein